MSQNHPGAQGGRLGGFVAELKRRHVVRAGIAYAAVGFVVLQAAEIVQQAFAFPDWGLRLVVVFTLLGLPLVLALAWVYEVTPLGLRATPGAGGAAAPTEAGGLPRYTLLAVVVVVVGASGWWWVRSTVAEVPAGGGDSAASFAGAPQRAPGEPIRSVAVLPLESFSDDPARDYFAQGMHEALISRLSQLDFVRVLSRTSAVEYDKSGKSLRQIGAELGVDAVIEGSVLSADDRVRITVQLIEVASDEHLWARDYERDLVDVIALQRDVADEIARELQGELAGAADMPVIADAASPSTDPEATEAVMIGRMALADLSNASAPRPFALDTAAAYFERAILRDSTLADAYRGLAQVRLLQALGDTGVPSAEAIQAVVRNATQALELDPEDRETREIIAHVADFDSLGAAWRDGAPVMAVTEMGRQLELAFARREAGSGEQGALRGARRLVAIGRDREAAQILERLTEADPRNDAAWDELEQLRRMTGDLDGVVELRRERARMAPGTAAAGVDLDALERAVDRGGFRGYWTWRLAELDARAASGASVSPLDLAAAQLGTGRRERALELLAEAAGAGDPRLGSVRVDPVWDPVRRDPRFAAVLEEVDELRPPRGAGGQRGRGGSGGPEAPPRNPDRPAPGDGG